MTSLPRCGIVGPGRLGRVLAVALHRAGCLLWVKGRSQEAAPWFAARSIRYATDWAELEPPELLWLTVPDRLITEVAAQCRQAFRGRLRGTSFVHCAGSLGSHILAAPPEEGLEWGAAHPFQTFPAEASPELLHCIAWTIESPHAQTQQRLVTLVRALQGIPVLIPELSPQQRASYHAAAALASNTLLALLRLAFELLQHLELPPALLLPPIVQTTLNHALAPTDPLPLTGPLVRQDWHTLQRHWEALTPAHRTIYRHFLLATAALALHNGLLAEEHYHHLASLLQPQ